MIVQWVQEHLAWAMGILAAGFFLGGFAIGTGWHYYRLNKAQAIRESNELLEQYLREPVRLDEDDDWTEYRATVRPASAPLVPVSHITHRIVLRETSQTRDFSTYLDAIPVSPAPTSYLGTPNYVPRHSTEGRTEAQVRALNTSTGSFPAYRPTPTVVNYPRVDWRTETWRTEGRLPEVRELVGV